MKDEAVDSMCKQSYSDVHVLEKQATDEGRKLMVEVVADSSGKFCGNGIRFETVDAAVSYARDLSFRWTSVREFRVALAPKE